MIKLDTLRQQYTLIKTAHEAVKKQVAIDRGVYLESEKNLHEIEGKLSLIKTLINKCGVENKINKALEPAIKSMNAIRLKGKNGSKHS